MNQLTEQEKELILRVASLIEEGSIGMQQITGHYFSLPNDHKQALSGCCAMGAMLKALGGNYFTSQHIDLLAELSISSWPRMGFPITDITPFAANPKTDLAGLPDVIIFLNDRLGYNFSMIVEYLRSVVNEV